MALKTKTLCPTQEAWCGKKVGIIGPTNLRKLSRLTRKPVKFFNQKTKEIGQFLASSGCELWINSDKGMAINIAKFYKNYGGRRLIILYPRKGEPWPKEHARPFKKYGDKLKIEPNWFWTNYNVVSLTDLCICVGLSAGTLSELAYIKWDCKLKRGKLKRLIAIRELLREKRLPPEIEIDVKNKLFYIDSVDNLKKVIKLKTS